MKISTFGTVVLLAFLSVAHPQEQTKGPPIAAAELNKRPVVGELGLPLGTVTEIQAQIITGRELRIKGYYSLYLLKVTHVSGNKLADSPTLKFAIPSFIRVQLARNTFGLYALKTGKVAKSLTSTQIENLEKGYVGKTVRLVVCEVGSFSGIPRNLPKDVPVWADHGFQFSTSLIILDELE